MNVAVESVSSLYSIAISTYMQNSHQPTLSRDRARKAKRRVLNTSSDSDIKQKLVVQGRFTNGRDQRFHDVRLNRCNLRLSSLRDHHLPSNTSRPLSRAYARSSAWPRNSRLRDLSRDDARFRSSRRSTGLSDRDRSGQSTRGSSRCRGGSHSCDGNRTSGRSTTRSFTSCSASRTTTSLLRLGRSRFWPGRKGVVLG